jgi:hypothetical protein
MLHDVQNIVYSRVFECSHFEIGLTNTHRVTNYLP